MPWRLVRIVEVLFRTFLTLAPLDGRETAASCSSHVTSGERAQNTHWVEQILGPTTCLNTVGKIFSCAWNRTSIIDHIVSYRSCPVFLIRLFIAFWCVLYVSLFPWNTTFLLTITELRLFLSLGLVITMTATNKIMNFKNNSNWIFLYLDVKFKICFVLKQFLFLI